MIIPYLDTIGLMQKKIYLRKRDTRKHRKYKLQTNQCGVGLDKATFMDYWIETAVDAVLIKTLGYSFHQITMENTWHVSDVMGILFSIGR